MRQIKNITENAIDVNDLGLTIGPGESINESSIPLDDLRSSADLPALINSDSLVVVVDGSELDKDASNSAINQTQNLDLSQYVKLDDVQAMISEALDNVATLPYIVQELWHLPIFMAKYSRFLLNSYNPDNSRFYSKNDVFYYIFNDTTDEQEVITLNGQGCFFGLLLPRLKSSSGGHELTVKLIVDGRETSEVLKYHNDSDDDNRAFFGAVRSNRSIYKEKGTRRKNASTNKRMASLGVVSNRINLYLPEWSAIVSDPTIPRIKFNQSLTIKLQCNQTGKFSTSNYKNRIVPLFNMYI